MVSGAVALLLQQRPSLTPDQVKRLLMDTATHDHRTATRTPPAPARSTSLKAARHQDRRPSLRASSTPTATGLGSLERSRGGALRRRPGHRRRADRREGHLRPGLVPADLEPGLEGPARAGPAARSTARSGPATRFGTDPYGQRTWAPVIWTGRSWSGRRLGRAQLVRRRSGPAAAGRRRPGPGAPGRAAAGRRRAGPEPHGSSRRAGRASPARPLVVPPAGPGGRCSPA